MSPAPVIVSLPIADRPTSFAFYRDGMGLDAVGELAADGVPEPLQFALGDGARLMLIPTGGFGWVIGDHEVAPRGQSECLLSVSLATDAAVDAAVERARTAGAEVTSPPARQPWGEYSATIADPDGHLWMLSSTPLGDS